MKVDLPALVKGIEQVGQERRQKKVEIDSVLEFLWPHLCEIGRERGERFKWSSERPNTDKNLILSVQDEKRNSIGLIAAHCIGQRYDCSEYPFFKAELFLREPADPHASYRSLLPKDDGRSASSYLNDKKINICHALLQPLAERVLEMLPDSYPKFEFFYEAAKRISINK